MGTAVAVAIMAGLAAIGLLWVWPTIAAARIGMEKQRENPWLWGLALGWIGVLILVNAPKPRPVVIAPFSGPAAPPTTRPCPMCAEAVQRAAKVCRHCGHQFAVTPGGPN
jgi:hypothetical protein